jgi:hypothetical protein
MPFEEAHGPALLSESLGARKTGYAGADDGDVDFFHVASVEKPAPNPKRRGRCVLS